MRTLPLLVAALLACESERLEAPEVQDAGHPVPTGDFARCRDCHAGPEDPVPAVAAPPAPTWHVLDCCGPDWDDCGDCHRPNAFRPPRFDHDEGSFPLVGRHRTAEGAPLRCDRCHGLDRDPDAAPGTCVSCHGAQRPTPSHAFVEADCGVCHTPDGFRGGAYAHDEVPLEVPHAEIRCEACHAERRPIRTDCACCHTRDAFGAPAAKAHTFPLRWRPFGPGESPAERTVCFPETRLEQPDARDCDACHAATFFEGGAYTHDTWLLTGAHGRADCVGCHLDRATRPPTACAGCHATDAPDDHTFGWPAPNGCTPCHGTDRWTADFDHGDDTAVPLLGGHARQSCDACHVQRVEDRSRTTCGEASCHAVEHAEAAAAPGHPDPAPGCGAPGCHVPGGRWR